MARGPKRRLVRAVHATDFDPGWSWMEEGLCRGTPPGLFFPDGAGKDVDRQVAAAKRVCAECPVRVECLDYALRNREVGVWGGTDEVERDRMRRSWAHDVMYPLA